MAEIQTDRQTEDKVGNKASGIEWGKVGKKTTVQNEGKCRKNTKQDKKLTEFN